MFPSLTVVFLGEYEAEIISSWCQSKESHPSNPNPPFITFRTGIFPNQQKTLRGGRLFWFLQESGDFKSL